MAALVSADGGRCAPVCSQDARLDSSGATWLVR